MTDNKFNDLVSGLVRTITDHKEIHVYCHEYACEEAGTADWSEGEWSDKEDTAQYDLYWANYAMCMCKITLRAAEELQGRIR